MPGYLLREQELLDLVDNRATSPIKDWLQKHRDDPVSVSVIGLARARAELESIPDPNERAESHRRS